MTQAVAVMEKVMAHAWLEPKALLAVEVPFPWPGTDVEEIDPDWWEPRWDQPWRRQVARDRKAFGGAYVSKAKPPNEGPNNPDRLARELEDAEFDANEAQNRQAEAESDKLKALARVVRLQTRLEEVIA